MWKIDRQWNRPRATWNSQRVLSPSDRCKNALQVKMSRFTSDEVSASIRSRSSTSCLNLGLFWGSSSQQSLISRYSSRKANRGCSKRRQARRLPQQNTERPAGNRRNVKSKQSAPVSNELSDPFTLQSTQVIKLDQRQEAFSTKQHACVQLESKSSFGKELSFGHHYKQVRCFNSDQINAKPIDQCHLHVSSMSENVVGHHLRCHPLIRQMTLTMTGANLRWGAPRFLRITQKFNFSL